MINFVSYLTLSSLKGVGLGSLSKTGGLTGLGKTGLLGKFGILFLLARLGIHGIWGIGTFFIVILFILIGIFYAVYRYRMGR